MSRIFETWVSLAKDIGSNYHMMIHTLKKVVSLRDKKVANFKTYTVTNLRELMRDAKVKFTTTTKKHHLVSQLVEKTCTLSMERSSCKMDLI